MPDIIQLLPDSIANQIAAGEVIQRPASVVKELLENAIDAGADEVNLIIKDAGKTLIQIIDNGKGMSETDVRMSIERHATSKIASASDLFELKTMGFRGEALASIASIAHLDIRTKQTDGELGTLLQIEGSDVVNQEAVTCKKGTSMSVKNLFYNVPARRKFLKSDNVEMRHIIDEFERVAIPNPHIKLTFHHNNNEIFHLEKGTFRQRIVQVFGKRYNEKLVPIEEETDIVKISGFIGKPETAKKTRGEQFFFVNHRFIKSAYLNHAIQEALEDLIPRDVYPSYFLMLDVNPSFIDVNIHPTKTEIKFEDERAIYAILRSSVRQGIGKNNVAPSLDFEQETSFNVPLHPTGPIQMPEIKVNPNYNPFDSDNNSHKPTNSGYSKQQLTPQQQHNRDNWEKLYQVNPEMADSVKQVFNPDSDDEQQSNHLIIPDHNQQEQPSSKSKAFQVHAKYIIAHIKSGLVMIHQSRAHERILYERYLVAIDEQKGYSQQQLFPQTVQLQAGDAELVKSISTDLQAAGVDIREFGAQTFVIQGLPDYATNQDPQTFIDGIVEHYKNNLQELRLEKREALARSLAKRSAIKTGKVLMPEEMENLIDELFACKNPYTTPSGRTIINTFTIDQLDNIFDK